jgi:hypothetical protein
MTVAAAMVLGNSDGDNSALVAPLSVNAGSATYGVANCSLDDRLSSSVDLATHHQHAYFASGT